MNPTGSSPEASGPVYTLDDFDFELPAQLIAQHPPARRTQSRLLDGSSWPPRDEMFPDLLRHLRAGDLLVFNDTRVMPARLYAAKPSGGRVELLVERVLSGGEVAAHLRASKKPAPGSRLALQAAAGSTDEPQAVVLGRWPDAQGALFHLRLENRLGEDPHAIMARHGHVPLPPYITHADTAEDAQRYQTVFAKHPGAVAAPTAALHFEEQTLDDIRGLGAEIAFVTLHVGAGTFQPVRSQDLSQHRMHREWYHMPASTVQAVQRCRDRGGRVVAIGTTSVRTLESWAQTGLAQGETDIFITPGYRFAVVDALLTNFHLPKSTLMMLVSAFAGYEHIRRLYAHAIAQRYRFFSYGDALWLCR